MKVQILYRIKIGDWIRIVRWLLESHLKGGQNFFPDFVQTVNFQFGGKWKMTKVSKVSSLKNDFFYYKIFSILMGKIWIFFLNFYKFYTHTPVPRL